MLASRRTVSDRPPEASSTAEEHRRCTHHLAEAIAPHAVGEGFIDTAIDGVRLIAAHCSHARTPLIYEPGLFVMAQGDKIGYLGDRVIHYGPGNYLVQALPLPFECETRADADMPLLGINIAFDPLTLNELVQQMPATSGDDGQAAPMAAVELDASMERAVLNLIECLGDETASRVLGPGRVREVLFAALKGPQGDSLRQLVQRNGQYARIVEALNYLHGHYREPLTVDALAARANMSASHFHHHFKRTTQQSPLQYLKRLRLLKARALLGQQRMNVARAADDVGYRSTSQFSREYKRYFGVSPSVG
ncbi:AraC family transcriptional regulator [Salinicola aestuarinus]|uniref:AraC family transcriptional regulator n=1 Tax=Salinicola aestuarinus TaxID=1949082 RepID=UPI000DA215F0|nr:AraC family transcriptional regulator [Salinicola aestuarinus]